MGTAITLGLIPLGTACAGLLVPVRGTLFPDGSDVRRWGIGCCPGHLSDTLVSARMNSRGLGDEVCGDGKGEVNVDDSVMSASEFCLACYTNNTQNMFSTPTRDVDIAAHPSMNT